MRFIFCKLNVILSNLYRLINFLNWLCRYLRALRNIFLKSKILFLVDYQGFTKDEL